MTEEGKERFEIKNARIDSFDAGFEAGRIVIKIGFTFAIGGLYYEESFDLDTAGDILAYILLITEAESLASVVGSSVRVTVGERDNHSFRVTRLWHFLNDAFRVL